MVFSSNSFRQKNCNLVYYSLQSAFALHKFCRINRRSCERMVLSFLMTRQSNSFLNFQFQAFHRVTLNCYDYEAHPSNLESAKSCGLGSDQDSRKFVYDLESDLEFDQFFGGLNLNKFHWKVRFLFEYCVFDLV